MTAPSQSPGAAEAQFLSAWANDIDGGRGAAVYSVDAERLRKCAALLADHDRLTEEVEKLREAAFDAYYLLMNIEAVLPDDIESVLALLRAALPRPAP